LINALENLDLRDDTLIIFTSDNGPTYIKGTYTPWFESAGPFKTEKGWGKGYLREGGIRVPLIFNWPGHIDGSSQSDMIAGAQDILPTIYDVLDIQSDLEHDGLSLAPTILGDVGDQSEHEYLYWEFPEYGGQRALRWGDYKAFNGDIHEGDTTIHLYNIQSDVQEQQDISTDHPELISFVKGIFEKEHTPSPNPRWRYDVLDH